MSNKVDLLINSMIRANIKFVTGVPDSMLAPLSKAFIENENIHHVTAVNEGSALSLALGNFVGSKSIPLIYLQNSGLGNIVNPYTSLVHEEVYAIPCILLIGWRGEPGVPDEPQHVVQGKITIPMLNTMGIPHFNLTKDSDIDTIISDAVKTAKHKNSGVAILVSSGVFENPFIQDPNTDSLSRIKSLELIINNSSIDSLFVSTTGKTSRELNELLLNSKVKNAFFTIGGMGHCSSIALGLHFAQPEKEIYCFDGDGAVQMHLGALATIGKIGPNLFTHVIFDNGVHESVGGQEVSNPDLNYELLAKSCGYINVAKVNNKTDLLAALNTLPLNAGPRLIIIKVNKSSSAKLSRPAGKPTDWKREFISSLGL
jgi:phosphonopyruvate decarboxylase